MSKTRLLTILLHLVSAFSLGNVADKVPTSAHRVTKYDFLIGLVTMEDEGP